MQDLLHMSQVSYNVPTLEGPLQILQDINFSVTQGKSVAIMGPSGSGKTSLLRLAAGQHKPSSGRILLAGHDLTAAHADQCAQWRRTLIGQVFQQFRLVKTLNALENVVLGLELAGITANFDVAEAALVEVGLGHRLKHFPETLSGGERQRVGIARALIHKPQLVLADEPTGNLDKDRAVQIFDLLLNAVSQTGAALVLVTHDPTLAMRCDQMIEISGGCLK